MSTFEITNKKNPSHKNGLNEDNNSSNKDEPPHRPQTLAEQMADELKELYKKAVDLEARVRQEKVSLSLLLVVFPYDFSRSYPAMRFDDVDSHSSLVANALEIVSSTTDLPVPMRLWNS